MSSVLVKSSVSISLKNGRLLLLKDGKKNPPPILFFFFEKLPPRGGDSLRRLAALVFARVEPTKDVPRTTAPGGFLLCEQLRHHESKSDDARCEKKKVGAFKESSPSSFVEKSFLDEIVFFLANF